MYERPFFMSLYSSVQAEGPTASEQLINQSGRNTGNLLFIEALRKITGATRESFSLEPTVEIEDDYDCVVLPAANWINPSFHYAGRKAEVLERLRLPIFVIGLGAQSNLKGDIPRLPKEVLRFLEVVSNRSRYLSLRGEFSQQVLDHLGVYNTRITGCPSLLWAADRGVSISKHQGRLSWKDIALHSTHHGNDQSLVTAPENIQAKLYRLAARNDVALTLQSEFAEFLIVGGRSIRDVPQPKETIRYLETLYGLDWPRLENYLSRHARMYYSVDRWVDDLRNFKFVLGTRVHGTIAALMAGVPAALIVHDSRTKELADVLRLPQLRSCDLGTLDLDEINQIYEELNTAEFEIGHQAYVERFRLYFEDIGLKVKLDGSSGTKFATKPHR